MSGKELSQNYFCDDTVNCILISVILTHTHTRLTALFSRTTQVSRYQKGKTSLDFTGARDSEWQFFAGPYASLHLTADASTPPLSFLQADALPAAQPTAPKH